MLRIINIIIRIITVLEICFFLALLVGKTVGIKASQSLFLTLVIGIFLFFGLFLLERSFASGGKTHQYEKPASFLLLFNILIIALYIGIAAKDRTMLWEQQFVQVIPVSPKEQVYYLNPILGLLGIVIIFSNWVLSPTYSWRTGKLVKPFFLLGFSIVITLLTAYFKSNPPPIVEFHG